MILYHLTDPDFLTLLENEKELICKPELGAHWVFEFPSGHVTNGFQDQYMYMYEQYAERTKQPWNPTWWAWVDKPDLRSERTNWPKDEEAMLITLYVPNELVLVSDFDIWCMVLNGWYIADNEQDDIDFDIRHYKINMLDDDYEIKTQERRDIIKKSWEKMFDYHSVKHPGNKDWLGSEPYLQAVFSPMKYEWVQDVKTFVGTRKDFSCHNN